MGTTPNNGMFRRDMLKTTGGIAVASALAGMTLPHVFAGEENTIKVALVGCGGRGTGAAINALSTKNGPTKLVAMADIFKGRLADSYKNIQKERAKQLEVPDERKFVSFDGYKQAIDCLTPGDVVILATPPAFRWVHFTYAVDKGVNVFMEKPVTVDGPTTRKMLKLAEESEEKNLKVGVGLMCRHCEVRGEVQKRIRDGQIGDLLLLRAYRMTGPGGFAFAGSKPDALSELLYQIKHFHAFLWASGGCFSDFLIHNIDECCWMKDAWPVQAKSSGGRHYRGNSIDQNFDVYSTEYTFADGTKFYLEGRNIEGCHNEFASYAHGTKGSVIFSMSSHFPAKSRIFKGQKFVKEDIVLERSGQGAGPLPARMGTSDGSDSPGQTVQRGQARRGSEPGHVDGPDGRAHGPGHHL